MLIRIRDLHRIGSINEERTEYANLSPNLCNTMGARISAELSLQTGVIVKNKEEFAMRFVVTFWQKCAGLASREKLNEYLKFIIRMLEFQNLLEPEIIEVLFKRQREYYSS